MKIDEAIWDRQRKLSKVDANGLTSFDKEVIGRPVRIEIPFEDPVKLKEIGEMLRGLANSIDFTVQRDDLPVRSKILHLKNEASAINRRIRKMHGMTRKWSGVPD